MQVEGSVEWLKSRIAVATAEQELAAAEGALRAIRGISLMN